MPAELAIEKRDTLVKKHSEPFFVKFLMNYFCNDRHKTRLKLLLPEVCVFEKGFPAYLLTKKKVSPT